MISPKEKGKMFRSMAFLTPTLSPVLIRGPLLGISMGTLEILVANPKALKKEVFSGSRPVIWDGTVTSQRAMAPAQVAAGNMASSMSLISVRSCLVNT